MKREYNKRTLEKYVDKWVLVKQEKPSDHDWIIKIEKFQNGDNKNLYYSKCYNITTNNSFIASGGSAQWGYFNVISSIEYANKALVKKYFPEELKAINEKNI